MLPVRIKSRLFTMSFIALSVSFVLVFYSTDGNVASLRSTRPGHYGSRRSNRDVPSRLATHSDDHVPKKKALRFPRSLEETKSSSNTSTALAASNFTHNTTVTENDGVTTITTTTTTTTSVVTTTTIEIPGSTRNNDLPAVSDSPSTTSSSTSILPVPFVGPLQTDATASPTPVLIHQPSPSPVVSTTRNKATQLITNSYSGPLLTSSAPTPFAVREQALCSAHPACAARGLIGFCCPSAYDFFLTCCNEVVLEEATASTSTSAMHPPTEAPSKIMHALAARLPPLSSPLKRPPQPTTDEELQANDLSLLPVGSFAAEANAIVFSGNFSEGECTWTAAAYADAANYGGPPSGNRFFIMRKSLQVIDKQK